MADKSVFAMISEPSSFSEFGGSFSELESDGGKTHFSVNFNASLLPGQSDGAPRGGPTRHWPLRRVRRRKECSTRKRRGRLESFQLLRRCIFKSVIFSRGDSGSKHAPAVFPPCAKSAANQRQERFSV